MLARISPRFFEFRSLASIPVGSSRFQSIRDESSPEEEDVVLGVPVSVVVIRVSRYVRRENFERNSNGKALLLFYVFREIYLAFASV